MMPTAAAARPKRPTAPDATFMLAAPELLEADADEELLPDVAEPLALVADEPDPLVAEEPLLVGQHGHNKNTIGSHEEEAELVLLRQLVEDPD